MIKLFRDLRVTPCPPWFALLLGLLAIASAGAYAQGRGGGEWTTASFDAQRTGSIRTDPRISVDALRKPGAFGPFKFLWKLKLEHDPQASGALTEPVLLDRLIGFRGFKSIAFVATASETVYAVDTDFGTPLWKYHINYSASPPPILSATPACPGGLTAALSRPTAVAPFSFAGGGAGGFGRGASGSGVGEPGRGAVTLATSGRGRGQGAPGAPAPAGAPSSAAVAGSAAAAAGAVPGGLPGGARQGGPPGPAFGRGGGPFPGASDSTYVVGSDGYLHALNVSNGWDNMTPALFLPANTRATGLIVATLPDGGFVAYAATTHGCGSQSDALWSMDLSSPQKTVVAFNVGAAIIAGGAGPAISRDGTAFIATTGGSAPLSNSVIALASKSLTLKSSTKVSNADFTSTPLVMTWNDKDVVAIAGSETLYLFDPERLESGPIATASLGAGKNDARSLAAWSDSDEARWIAVPSAHGIATFKVAESGGKLSLQPGWTSRAMTAPLPPLVINGVMFTASTGMRTAPGVLYAIDAANGKDLWSSGRTITSTVHSGLSGGQGNVYVPGTDGTLYAFGFDIEK